MQLERCQMTGHRQPVDQALYRARAGPSAQAGATATQQPRANAVLARGYSPSVRVGLYQPTMPSPPFTGILSPCITLAGGVPYSFSTMDRNVPPCCDQ